MPAWGWILVCLTFAGTQVSGTPIEIGAGTAIPSVRHFSEETSRKYGARIIRINPREFDVPSKLDVGIPMGSLEALLAIDDALNAWPQEIDLNFMGIA